MIAYNLIRTPKHSGQPGIGSEFKERTRELGPWMTYIPGFGEMLPNPENRVTLSNTKTDQWVIPLVEINCAPGPNEHKTANLFITDCAAMASSGCQNPSLT